MSPIEREAMRAVVLRGCCEPNELRVESVPVPSVKPGWVLIEVKAFGLNRSELMLRSFEAEEDYIELPRIPGIECVGVVADPSDSRFRAGERVAALMGGMGRSFDGGYAEYVLVPEKNVFSIEGFADLSWDELAAIPETWFTAFGSLFECLRLQSGESLLVRGGTSALGLAAAQIAKALDCFVVSTTRSAAKREKLLAVGVDAALVDKGEGSLLEAARGVSPRGFDAVLDLVGPSTLRESLRLAAHPGRVCMTGLLGSPEPLLRFDPIFDIPNGVSLSGFYSNYPEQGAVDSIFGFVREHGLHPLIGARYGFEQIGEAHADMEASRVFGKAVVVTGDEGR